MKTTEVILRSDECLLSTLKQGKLQSFGDLYLRYYPKVYHTCFSYAKNHDDAFDLAQDALLKALVNIETFKGKSTFSTWLFSITRNHCLSLKTKKGRIFYEDVQAAHILAAEEFSSDDLKKREKKEQLELQLQHCMDLLPLEDKRMLELKYYHNFTIKDLQDEFDLSASAVKMRLLRARQRVERIIDARAAA